MADKCYLNDPWSSGWEKSDYSKMTKEERAETLVGIGKKYGWTKDEVALEIADMEAKIALYHFEKINDEDSPEYAASLKALEEADSNYDAVVKAQHFAKHPSSALLMQRLAEEKQKGSLTSAKYGEILFAAAQMARDGAEPSYDFIKVETQMQESAS